MQYPCRKATNNILSGDFNTHRVVWWPVGNPTRDRRKRNDLLTTLGLLQLIHERNFKAKKHCIDLAVTDQPNIVLDCGTHDTSQSFK